MTTKKTTNEQREAELLAGLEAAKLDLWHGSTPTWRAAAKRAVELIEAELAEIQGKIKAACGPERNE